MTQLFEGVGIALAALRSNKLRDLVTEFLSKAAEFGFGPDDLQSELAERLPRGKKESS